MGIELTLPATSANLGPAFDAAALALSLRLRVSAELAADFAVAAEGRDRAVCGEVRDHLIFSVYRDVLLRERGEVRPIAIRLQNEIPIGKGCGSSAAARIAGILLAVHFGKLDWSDERILAEAAWREGHPDNAAACWLGGLAVARQVSASELTFRRFEKLRAETNNLPLIDTLRVVPAVRWPLLLAVPPAPLSTEQARAVLPEQYSRADAVANVQNALSLVLSFVQGRGDLLRVAIDDRLHQPYRASLCPLFPALRGLVGEAGILSATLSGAGPSVLLILDPGVPPGEGRARVEVQLRAMNLSAELLAAEIENRGAKDAISIR